MAKQLGELIDALEAVRQNILNLDAAAAEYVAAAAPSFRASARNLTHYVGLRRHNKGPHIEEVVRPLDGILRRMEAHQDKKRARLRPLRVARLFPERSSLIAVE